MNSISFRKPGGAATTRRCHRRSASWAESLQHLEYQNALSLSLHQHKEPGRNRDLASLFWSKDPGWQVTYPVAGARSGKDMVTFPTMLHWETGRKRDQTEPPATAHPRRR